MNVSSFTYNGEEVDPEGFLSIRTYRIIEFLLRELTEVIGKTTTEEDLIVFHSELIKKITRYDKNLNVRGNITSDHDGMLNSVSIPLVDKTNNDVLTLIFKWGIIGQPLKVQVLDN